MAARELARAGVRPTIFDPNPPGGILITREMEGNLVECGPDSLVAQKAWALEFIREIGMGEQLVGSNDSRRRTLIYRQGKLIPLPDGMHLMVPTRLSPVLASPLLGIGTKARMALDTFRRSAPAASGDRTVAQFIREHYGQEAVDYLAEPLLAGVYGGDVDQLSASSTVGRLVELEQQFGSLSRGVLAKSRGESTSKGSIFYTLRGGMQSLGRELGRQLEGSCEFVRDKVDSVDASHGRVTLQVHGTARSFEHVVLACPAANAASLLRASVPELANELDAIPYSSCGTVTLAYREQDVELPAGFGLLVPRRERKHLAACTFIGQKFPHRVAAGWKLIRCFLAGEDIARADEQEAVKVAREELARVMGIRAVPEWSQWNGWPRSMPQYVVGHAARVGRIEAILQRNPGIHLASNYLQGVGLADAILSGRKAAKGVLA